MDKQICGKHIEDSYLAYYIRRNGEPGICSYCKDTRTRKVMEIDDLAEFIQKGIGLLFDDAAEWLPYETAEGGYQGTTYSTSEVLSSELALEMDELVFDDLDTLIDDIAWCRTDPYGDSQSEMLLYDWNDFKRIICHQQRYTIFLAEKIHHLSFTVKVAQILEEIGQLVFDYHLIKVLPSGTKLLRCRQHDTKTRITDAVDICAPEEKHSLYSNRMSPAGISMFYCAFEEKIAKVETIDPVDRKRPLYTIATFQLLEETTVIDLSHLPPLPSIFNRSKIKHYHPLLFLHGFVKDVSSRVVKNSNIEHMEYIPTQVVTEYFRYIFSKDKKMKISGIIYPCSIESSKQSMVLFYDHEESLEKLKFIASSIRQYRIARKAS